MWYISALLTKVDHYKHPQPDCTTLFVHYNKSNRNDELVCLCFVTILSNKVTHDQMIYAELQIFLILIFGRHQDMEGLRTTH